MVACVIATQVVCVNLLKMQLIAQSCVSLGFTTLVHNLLRSITPTKTGAVAWLQVRPSREAPHDARAQR